MNKTPNTPSRWEKLTAWVDGDREPKDQTLFVMERRPPRPEPDVAESERRERHRLRRFLEQYPFGAILICLILTAVLMVTVLHLPTFGQAGNPINNEVSQHYLEQGEAETGSSNAVSAMILSYRGFDTLGESCVLFLSVVGVMMLLLRDEKNTDEHDLRKAAREEAALQAHHDVILAQAAWILIPFIFLFAIYVLLHGEESPGGGFSGGTILGGGFILFANAFGVRRLRKFLNRKTYSVVRTLGLLLYALLYGGYIFIGANGLPNYLEGMTLFIDLAVGLVVACTVYGFYALFSQGDI